MRSSQSGHLSPSLICIVIMGNITKADLSVFTVEGMINSSHVYDLKKGVREKSFFFLFSFLKMVNKRHDI